MRPFIILFALALVACEKDKPAQPNSPAPPVVAIGTPILQAPANGATGIWTPCTYSWTAVPGAHHYHLEATRTTTWGQTSTHLSAPNLLSNSYTFSGSLTGDIHDATVSWKVRAVSTNGVTGAWSNTFTYTLQ